MNNVYFICYDILHILSFFFFFFLVLCYCIIAIEIVDVQTMPIFVPSATVRAHTPFIVLVTLDALFPKSETV